MSVYQSVLVKAKVQRANNVIGQSVDGLQTIV